MIRFLLRASGFLLCAAAFAALVVDGTRSIAAQRVLQVPLGEMLAWSGGATSRAWLDGATRWPEPGAQLAAAGLALPGWIVFAISGFALSAAGCRPRSR